MRLFNLLKDILTFGNRIYAKVGNYNMAATAQSYTIGSMTVSKAGTYLVLAIADHNFGATNKIMGLNISIPSGVVKSITGTYTTRTVADAGGGLTNFRLARLEAGTVVSASTYNYTGVAGRVDYSLVAIRLLAGGGYFIGSPVWRWAYEIIHLIKADYQLEAKQDVAEAGELIRRNQLFPERVYRNGSVCKFWRGAGWPKHTDITHTIERNKNALCWILQQRSHLRGAHKDVGSNYGTIYWLFSCINNLRPVDWGCAA